MSKAQHTEAQLGGFEGPFFPGSIHTLHHLLDEVRVWDERWLDKAGAAITGYQGMGSGTVTTDGYDWYRSLYFNSAGGRVVVLVPWAQDWDKADDSQADRSPAVHTRGVTESEAEALLKVLVTAIQNQATAPRCGDAETS